jgi:hypothetical protein
MARQATQWSVVSRSRELSAAQRSHLADLDAKRRLLLAIRRGQVPAPEAFDEERERKLDDLRTAGCLNVDQELFLRLSGADAVDQQHAMCLALGSLYGGIIVPSLRTLRNERQVQKHCVRFFRGGHEQAHARPKGRAIPGRVPLRRPMRIVRARRARRVARRVARSPASSASDGSSDPPPGRVCESLPGGGAS